MDLELIRKYVSAKEIIEHYSLSYSEETIKSVLYGRRKNERLVQLACTYAIEKMSIDIVQIKSYMNTNKESTHPFIEMDIQQKIESLCKMKSLKEIQELKKELIKLNLFENLEDEVQGFLKDLKINSLRLLRYNRRF